jgi:hypothetical protein
VTESELAAIEAHYNQSLERDSNEVLRESLYNIVFDYAENILKWTDEVPGSQAYNGEGGGTPIVDELVKLVQYYGQGIPALLAEVRRLREWIISEGYSLDE